MIREMPRKYELKRRAERAEETRRRSAEAALELHSTIGPSRTTVSAVAERAGVQRHTYYAHYPDERTLHYACSGLQFERHPLPDPAAWKDVADPDDRLRRALTALYGYYAEHEQLMGHVARDAETHPLIAEVTAARFGPPLAAMVRSVVAGYGGRGKRRRLRGAAVGLALDFRTWQNLVRHGSLTQRDAVELMVRAVACV
jgi:AcrR family transcriptional regulator